jgi:hypothetical protein
MSKANINQNISYWSVGWDYAGNLRTFAIKVEAKEISPCRLRIGAESVYQAAERCKLTLVLPEPMFDVEMWAVNKYSDGGYFVMDNIIHAEQELGATKAIEDLRKFWSEKKSSKRL